MIPLLKLNEPVTEPRQFINAERAWKTCREWIEYYEKGGRICRLIWPGQASTVRALILCQPTANARILTMEVATLKIGEVWSHAVPTAPSSVFVEYLGALYQASAINGWKFKEPDWKPGQIKWGSVSAEVLNIIDTKLKPLQLATV